MLRPSSLAAAVLLALAPALPAQEVPPGAVAVVGSVAIPRGRLEEEVARGLFARDAAGALAYLVELETLRQGLVLVGRDPEKVSEAELAEARKRLEARGLGAERLAKMSRVELALGVCFEGWLELQLDEATLRRAWAEERVKLVGKARARALLVEKKRDAGPGEALARARALLTELGGKDPGDEGFAQLCRQRSDDPAAATTGGDLDWFGPGGQTALGERLPPALVRACFARGTPGLLPDPIVAGDAVWLVRVTAFHLPPEGAFEEHREEARVLASVQVQRRAMEEWKARFPVRYAPDAPRHSTRDDAPGD